MKTVGELPDATWFMDDDGVAWATVGVKMRIPFTGEQGVLCMRMGNPNAKWGTPYCVLMPASAHALLRDQE